MGKKSKQTTTNEPSAYAKGYITPAADALSGTYNANSGNVQNISNQLSAAFPGFLQQATSTSPVMGAANGYATDVLNGKYLGQGNPYLSGMIDQTDRSVSDRVNSTFGAAGRTGGTQHTQVLGQSLADAENGLRYSDYANERNAMMQALGQAPGLDAAKYAGIAPTLALGQTAAGLPMQAAGQYAGGIGSLLGQYNTQTQTQKPSPFSSLMQGIGTAAQAASVFSDRRLKENVERVGELPDGLGVYDYDYVWGGDRQRGVMADEVAELSRPPDAAVLRLHRVARALAELRVHPFLPGDLHRT